MTHISSLPGINFRKIWQIEVSWIRARQSAASSSYQP